MRNYRHCFVGGLSLQCLSGFPNTLSSADERLQLPIFETKTNRCSMKYWLAERDSHRGLLSILLISLDLVKPHVISSTCNRCNRGFFAATDETKGKVHCLESLNDDLSARKPGMPLDVGSKGTVDTTEPAALTNELGRGLQKSAKSFFEEI